MKELGFRVWSNYWKKYATEAELHMDGSADAIFEDDDGVPHHENTDLVVESPTGLKDMDGKEIYEGDIVQIDDHILGDFEVLWHNLGWAIKRSIGFETLSVHKPEDIVVIGNIHENPELLEEEK